MQFRREQTEEPLDKAGEAGPCRQQSEEEQEATKDCAYGNGQHNRGALGDASAVAEYAHEQEPRRGDGDDGHQGEAVEHPLHGHAAQGGAGAEVFLAGEVVGAHQFAETHGEQVVGGVADYHHRIQAAHREPAQGGQQILPAVGAEQDSDKVERDGWDEINVVGLGQQSFQLAWLKLPVEEKQHRHADGDSCPQVPAGCYETYPAISLVGVRTVIHPIPLIAMIHPIPLEIMSIL